MNKARYLPLFNADGTWIKRPDLYLLAKMGVSDNHHESEVEQIYSAMLSGDPVANELNSFEDGIERRHIRKDVRLRTLTASVVLEAYRIDRADPGAATVNKAVELVSYSQRLHEGEKAEIESVRRAVWKGMAEYGNTAHLHAAWLYSLLKGEVFENDRVLTERFLGTAKCFESFIDVKLVSNRWSWHPWRIPEQIEPLNSVSIPAPDYVESASCKLK